MEILFKFLRLSFAEKLGIDSILNIIIKKVAKKIDEPLTIDGFQTGNEYETYFEYFHPILVRKRFN